MKHFVVAVFAQGDDVIALHSIRAATWQEAATKSPAIWWHVPNGMDYEAMQEEARNAYNCQVSVCELGQLLLRNPGV